MVERSELPDVPSARECFERAATLDGSAPGEALAWLRRVVDGGPDYVAWQAAAHLLVALSSDARHLARRSVRLGILGSYTTRQFGDLLRLAAFRFGVWIDLYEADYNQYAQEILDENSGLYAFEPDIVLFAVDEQSLWLPQFSDTPDDDVAQEVERWLGLFREAIKRSGCRVVHHTFAAPPTEVFGNLNVKVAGSRRAMVRAVNSRLTMAVPGDVSFVDCEALAASLGKHTWFDDRYWYFSKQAVSLEALPELARHSAAVIAGQLGLARKALVLDLDNTLWGGVVGEDGITGITLGQGSPEGEAFVAFQRYCSQLHDRGIVLAICSKNDADLALEVFRTHPGMVLREDDIAVFVANWEAKAENILRIANDLGLGLDALVFVDDDSTERDLVRQLLPEVEVVAIPKHPFGRIDALATSLHFEAASFTNDDRNRPEQYRGRAAVAELQRSSSSLEDSLAKLEMRASAEPFDEVNIARVTQLVGKTNQFNLTGRRHSAEQLRRFAEDPENVTLAVRLRDRFVDHGLVSVLVGRPDAGALIIDTWVMSCRVIGRGLERWILDQLAARARTAGMKRIEGHYLRTNRNGLVADLFGTLGFEPAAETPAGTTWSLDLADYDVGDSAITTEAP